MIVFIAIDCHAHTITTAIHAIFVLDSMLEEIKRRGIGEACHREIQILVVWKSYFYALNLLDRTLEIERNFYIDHIADLFEKKRNITKSVLE